MVSPGGCVTGSAPFTRSTSVCHTRIAGGVGADARGWASTRVKPALAWTTAHRVALSRDDRVGSRRPATLSATAFAGTVPTMRRTGPAFAVEIQSWNGPIA